MDIDEYMRSLPNPSKVSGLVVVRFISFLLFCKYYYIYIPFYIVQVDVPESVAKKMFIISNLVNIGFARWASEGDLLTLINSMNSGIIELSIIPIR